MFWTSWLSHILAPWAWHAASRVLALLVKLGTLERLDLLEGLAQRVVAVGEEAMTHDSGPLLVHSGWWRVLGHLLQVPAMAPALAKLLAKALASKVVVVGGRWDVLALWRGSFWLRVRVFWLFWLLCLRGSTAAQRGAHLAWSTKRTIGLGHRGQTETLEPNGDGSELSQGGLIRGACNK